MEKKITVLTLSLFTVLTASARNEGPDTTVLEILSILFLVFGVLQIILFFKVWGMTNNVKRIKDGLAQKGTIGEGSVDEKVRLQLLLGNKEDARRILLVQMAQAIDKVYDKLLVNGSQADAIYEQDITPVVDEFKARMQEIGMEMPAQAAQIKTIGDYYNLYKPKVLNFKANDFVVVKV